MLTAVHVTPAEAHRDAVGSDVPQGNAAVASRREENVIVRAVKSHEGRRAREAHCVGCPFVRVRDGSCNATRCRVDEKEGAV